MKSLFLRPSKIAGFSAAWFLLAASILAQTQQTNPTTGNRGTTTTTTAVTHTIRGKIFLPSGVPPEQRIRIVLEVTSGGVAQEVFSDSIGNFEFRSVPNNMYRITIPTDRELYDTAQETLEVSGNFSRTFMVQIFLKEKTPEFGAKPKGKIVSAVENSQEVPKNAKKAYEQGLKRAKDKKAEEAILFFQQALKIFPDYLLALNQLGEQYLHTNRKQEAQAAFERALAVNSKFALPHINLGIVLIAEKQFDQAIAHLEAANQIDSTYPMGHLQLGIALMDKTPSDFDRAERELLEARELGGVGLAYAHLHLFNLHLRRQAYGKAVEQLEAYLQDAPNANNADAVRETLGKLKKQMAQQPQTVKKQ